MSLAPLLRLGVSYVFHEAQTRLETQGRICATAVWGKDYRQLRGWPSDRLWTADLSLTRGCVASILPYWID